MTSSGQRLPQQIKWATKMLLCLEMLFILTDKAHCWMCNMPIKHMKKHTKRRSEWHRLKVTVILTNPLKQAGQFSFHPHFSSLFKMMTIFLVYEATSNKYCFTVVTLYLFNVWKTRLIGLICIWLKLQRMVRFIKDPPLELLQDQIFQFC